MRLVEGYTQRLRDDLRDGADLGEAMKRLTLAHAGLLRELGPIGVLAFDPCPRCGGAVIAEVDDSVAKCAAGCGWELRRQT